MAIEILNRVLHAECPDHVSKLVLIVLANHANVEGRCWPGTSRIARMCQLHPDTVKKARRRLKEAGLLEFGQPLGSTLQYRIKVECLSETKVVDFKKVGDHNTPGDENSGVTTATGGSDMNPPRGVTRTPVGGDVNATKTLVNQKEKSEVETATTSTSRKPQLEALKKRINTWFGKSVDHSWEPTRYHELMGQAHRAAEEWDQLERYLLAPAPRTTKEEDPENLLHYRRCNIRTLMPNLACEFEKAEEWEFNQAAASPRQDFSRPYWLDPPCPEWQALAEQHFPGRDASLDWDDFDPSLQRELHTIFA